MKIAVFGAHTRVWRGLCSALTHLDHRVVFFEHELPRHVRSRDTATLLRFIEEAASTA